MTDDEIRCLFRPYMRDIGLERTVDASYFVERIKALFEAFRESFRKRFEASATVPPIDEFLPKSEHKKHVFCKLILANCSPDMLVMAWRVLQGCEIKKISVGYEYRSSFSFVIEIQSPYEETIERYESTSLKDFPIIRHFSFLWIDNEPVIDGLYPF